MQLARTLGIRKDLVRALSSPDSIKGRLQAELSKALRVKDAGRASVLRQVQAELVKVEKAPAGVAKVSESEVLQRCIRRWRETIAEYEGVLQKLQSATSAEVLLRREQVSRVLATEMAELGVICSFLPPPYPPGELSEHIEQAVLEIGPQARQGDVMKALLSRLDPSRVDKQELASQIRHKLEASQKDHPKQ